MIATGLFGLFVWSLLASTILPGGVEVLLYAMVESQNYSSLALLGVATAGNTIGGVITYALGRILNRAVTHARWLSNWRARFNFNLIKVKPAALARVRKWGVVCLLFSWMPIVGDPLCLAAGYLRLALLPSAIAIAIGKFLRYLILLLLFGWR